MTEEYWTLNPEAFWTCAVCHEIVNNESMDALDSNKKLIKIYAPSSRYWNYSVSPPKVYCSADCANKEFDKATGHYTK